MCRVLGVSPSGFYAWRHRPPSARSRADAQLSLRMSAIHQRSHATYGAPRVHAELRAEGIKVGRKRVARLLKKAGLIGASRRKWIHTTVRDRNARPAPDLVERNFLAPQPNCLWVADITYIPTWAGFLYLAVVLDVFSRRIVGWAMETHLRTELVLEALDYALWQRRPDAVIHHSDQGTQYTSIQFGARGPRSRGAPFDGLGRRLLRQRDVRKLLRDPGMRTARAPPLQDPARGADGGVRVHRGLVQPASAPFRPRLSLADQLRKDTSLTTIKPKLLTLH